MHRTTDLSLNFYSTKTIPNFSITPNIPNTYALKIYVLKKNYKQGLNDPDLLHLSFD